MNICVDWIKYFNVVIKLVIEMFNFDVNLVVYVFYVDFWKLLLIVGM